MTDRPREVVCARCFAENDPKQSLCFLCGTPLDAAGPAGYAPPAPLPKRGVLASIHIGTIMLIIALVAVLLGVWREAPGFAVLIGIFSAIALSRTIASAARAETPRTTLQHAGVFLGSFLFSFGVFVASCAAFFVSCLAVVSTGEGDYGGNMLGTGLLVGAIFGLGTLIGLPILNARLKARWRAGRNPPGSRDNSDTPRMTP